MSTFLSYSRLGALVGGFRPLSVRRRQGAWTRVTDDQANTPAWLDDTRLIWQQDAYRNDGRQAFLETSDGRTYARKASVLAAGAGRWVAQYEQAAPGKSAKAVVLYDGLERTIYGDARTDHPSGFWGAGQHSVGHDGTLAYTPRFHEGRGVIVEAIDGSVLTRDDRIPVTTTSAIAWDAVVVWSAAEASHVWYWDGATWTRHRLAWPAYGGTAFRGRDGVYLAYSSGAQERAIVHRVDDASRGWLLGRKDHCYNACGWTDHVTGETWIAWSENAGATTDSVREERLVGEPKPWPVAPPTPITVPTLEKTSLKIGLLVFDHPARQIIEVGEAPSTATGAVLYTLSRGWLSQSRALAKTLDLYCLIYGDAHGLTPDRVPDDGDCLGLIYAYPSSYLTATQTLKLVEADCKAFARAKRQMAINLALYRRVRVSAAGEVSYDVDEQKMLDVFAGAWDIANKYGITLRTLYTQRRGNADTGLIDGIDKWPSAQELLRRAKASVKSSTEVPRPKKSTPPTPTTPSAPSFVDRAREIAMSTTRRVTLQLAGKYVGADPTATDESAYADREQAQGWEVLLLTKLDDGKYVAQFEAAHKAMCVTDRQTIETRPWEARGGWEIGRAAEIPPDWPSKLLYDNGLVFDLAYLD